MSENNTILQTIISEAQRHQLRLDTYIELLQNTYEEYRTMISSPENMLSRIVNLTCNCEVGNMMGGDIVKDPSKHDVGCTYRHLYGI